MWEILAPILRAISAIIEILKDRHVAANTAEMVQQKTAANIQLDQDEIAALIRTAHYDPDPAKRKAAFEEIQRREAIT